MFSVMEIAKQGSFFRLALVMLLNRTRLMGMVGGECLSLRAEMENGRSGLEGWDDVEGCSSSGKREDESVVLERENEIEHWLVRKKSLPMSRG